MRTPERGGWLAPTLALIAAWAVATVALVAILSAMRQPQLGTVAKVAPFFVAGLVAARFTSVSQRRARIIAVAALAIVAAVAWTLFTFATTEIGTNKSLALFGVSLPVMLFASLWAYLGMYLGGRGQTSRTLEGPGDDPELAELERDLRSEIERERD